jgi:hypothetical protein
MSINGNVSVYTPLSVAVNLKWSRRHFLRKTIQTVNHLIGNRKEGSRPVLSALEKFFFGQVFDISYKLKSGFLYPQGKMPNSIPLRTLNVPMI